MLAVIPMGILGKKWVEFCDAVMNTVSVKVWYPFNSGHTFVEYRKDFIETHLFEYEVTYTVAEDVAEIVQTDNVTTYTGNTNRVYDEHKTAKILHKWVGPNGDNSDWKRSMNAVIKGASPRKFSGKTVNVWWCRFTGRMEAQ
jgi:hypothetical protein